MTMLRDWTKRHPWTSGLGLALAACVLAVLVLWFQLNGVRSLSAEQKSILDEMRDVADRYREEKALIARADTWLTEPGSLSSTVSRIADEKGMAANIMEKKLRPIPHGEELLEQVLQLSLRVARRKDVVDFLLAVESDDPATRTKTLRITPNKNRRQLIDVEVKFSAYEKIAKK